MNEKKESYFNLLIRRENLIKEGDQIYIEYVKIFGELLIKRYEVLMEIAKLRKMISFCVKKRNYGENINGDELERYINLEMKIYEEELNNLIRTKKEADSCELISIYDSKKCKKLYYDIAKKIHPDLHPNITDEMLNIFNEAKEAYENDDLKTLERLYDMVLLLNEEDAEIFDIDEKINNLNNEIDELIKEEPYILKYEFTPEEMKKENIMKFKDEIESSKVILEQLQNEFDKFEIINEVS